MHHHLALLGWDDAWASSLDDLPGVDHLPGVDDPVDAGVRADPVPHAARRVGRVCRADTTSCDVLVPAGPDLRAVTAAWGPGLRRAHRQDPARAPVTGDWVLLDDGEPPAVEAVLPRRSTIRRAQTDGSSRAQVLAANADVVAVVEGLAPDPDPGRVERLLALAWASGATPVVVLTKADLVPDAAARAAQVADLAPGADVLTTAAPEGLGLDPLRRLLAAGATVALLGASGVGKSTLLNALVGDAVMRTRGLRTDGKGRHTTVTRELHLCPGGGAVLDTPGMRTIGLAGEDGLAAAFADVDDLAAACRFADCGHESEPGCAVLAAVAAGDLTERRLASWRKLAREAQHQAARTDARLRSELTQVWKQRQKDYRRRPNRKV